jgi:large subunit ribosomal protein L13
MKSCTIKPADFAGKSNWVEVDATGHTLGRLATQIAHILRGKHKPTFTPHIDCGDSVVVVNADKIKVTGNKLRDKVYYHHTGYIGGIKAITAEDLMEKNPAQLINKAVKGMLPKNKLARKQILKLKVYAGSEHPHKGQKPSQMPISRVAEQG